MEKLLRVAKVFQFFGGTNGVQRMAIAECILGEKEVQRMAIGECILGEKEGEGSPVKIAVPQS